MDIIENNHCHLSLQLNKITCIDDLYKYFDKELVAGNAQKIDKQCISNLLKNFSECDKIKSNNIKAVTLSITGWKSMSRKNERLFDYFLDTLKQAEKERQDNIKFNYRLIEEW